MTWGGEYRHAIAYVREPVEPTDHSSDVLLAGLDAGLGFDEFGELVPFLPERKVSEQRRVVEDYVERVNRWDPGRLVIVDWEQDPPEERRPAEERPGLRRALRSLRYGGADVLIVPSLDSICRSLSDLVALWDAYFTAPRALVAVEDDIDGRDDRSGRQVLAVLRTMAEWRTEECKAKAADALAGLRARNEPSGGDVRIGHRRTWSGREAEDLDEQRAVETVKQLDARGVSVRGIAAHLNRSDRRPRGSRWHPTTVARILARIRSNP